MNTDTRIQLPNNNTYFLRISLSVAGILSFSWDSILGRRHHYPADVVFAVADAAVTKGVFMENCVSSHQNVIWRKTIKRVYICNVCCCLVVRSFDFDMNCMRKGLGTRTSLNERKPCWAGAWARARQLLFIYLTCNCSIMICLVIHHLFGYISASILAIYCQHVLANTCLMIRKNVAKIQAYQLIYRKAYHNLYGYFFWFILHLQKFISNKNDLICLISNKSVRMFTRCHTVQAMFKEQFIHLVYALRRTHNILL